MPPPNANVTSNTPSIVVETQVYQKTGQDLRDVLLTIPAITDRLKAENLPLTIENVIALTKKDDAFKTLVENALKNANLLDQWNWYLKEREKRQVQIMQELSNKAMTDAPRTAARRAEGSIQATQAGAKYSDAEAAKLLKQWGKIKRA